jgi:hypothetical protein
MGRAGQYIRFRLNHCQYLNILVKFGFLRFCSHYFLRGGFSFSSPQPVSSSLLSFSIIQVVLPCVWCGSPVFLVWFSRVLGVVLPCVWCGSPVCLVWFSPVFGVVLPCVWCGPPVCLVWFSLVFGVVLQCAWCGSPVCLVCAGPAAHDLKDFRSCRS